MASQCRQPLEPHIKSLDAIHLGTVLDTGLDATVVTHDTTMAHVVSQLGYTVLDPVP